MDYELNPYGEGPPPPVRGPRRVSRAALTVGLAAFLGLGGAGAAFALTGSGSSTPSLSADASTTTSTSVPSSPSSPKTPPPGWRGPGGGGLFGGIAGGNVVHGEYTIKSGSGYKTVLVQTGSVVTVSQTSIEVKSSDGYDHTYTVQPTTVVDSQANGISTVAAQDQVRVEAVQQSGSDVATDIVDTTKVGSSRTGFGFGPAQSPAQTPGG
ncbi:MAG: hypothetical protein JO337_13225 [Acidimicrobiales bacterium]|nr:hypothetical protein [Acidimicrobiales bacterium]